MQLLHKRGKADGSFLIRPNSRRPGYYALTLMHNQTPYHYEIVCEVSECAVLVFGTDVKQPCSRCVQWNLYNVDTIGAHVVYSGTSIMWTPLVLMLYTILIHEHEAWTDYN